MLAQGVIVGGQDDQHVRSIQVDAEADRARPQCLGIVVAVGEQIVEQVATHAAFGLGHVASEQLQQSRHDGGAFENALVRVDQSRLGPPGERTVHFGAGEDRVPRRRPPQNAPALMAGGGDRVGDE